MAYTVLSLADTVFHAGYRAAADVARLSAAAANKHLEITFMLNIRLNSVICLFYHGFHHLA